MAAVSLIVYKNRQAASAVTLHEERFNRPQLTENIYRLDGWCTELKISLISPTKLRRPRWNRPRLCLAPYISEHETGLSTLERGWWLDRRCQASRGNLKYALVACNLNYAVYFRADAEAYPSFLLSGILTFLSFFSLNYLTRCRPWNVRCNFVFLAFCISKKLEIFYCISLKVKLTGKFKVKFALVVLWNRNSRQLN